MKLLLIMPNFFDYPELIVAELNNLGYEVDYFDDRPSSNAWVKAIIRINKDFIHTYIKQYFNEIMKTIRNKKYDIVLLISGQSLSLSENMIADIKECQAKAKFVLYQWDSEKNFPYIRKIQKFFDVCYTFDRKDAEVTPKLRFLPLFYSRTYENIAKCNTKNYKYDFCFIGTAHPKKYKFIKMMSNQLKDIYPRQYIYFYFPSPIVFFYRKIMNKELRKAKYSEFHYTPLGGNDIIKIYESSKCVLDSAQAGQSGLTIRVIEALGANKKIITTNEDIINYDFYRPENIYIYKGYIDLNNIFFHTGYKEVRNDIYKKYSLNNWLKTVTEKN